MPHTRGPWRWVKHEDDEGSGPHNPGFLFALDEPSSVANERHPGEYLGVSVLHAIYPSHGDKYVHITVKPEDAALIAAAPDLLAALQGLVLEHDTQAAEDRRDAGMAQPWIGPCSCGSCDDARTAIAKARGEAIQS